MEELKLNLYETKVISYKNSFSGTEIKNAELVTGSRLLFTLYVSAIDVGATITVLIKNRMSVHVPWEVIETFTSNAPSNESKVLGDVHNAFEFEVIVSGGNASYYFGISIADNALFNRIGNAELQVDLNHVLQANGNYDSVRVGDGVEELQMDENGNANVQVHGDDPYGDDVILTLSQEGRPNPRGDYDLTSNSKPASVGLIAHGRNVLKTEAHQLKRITAIDSTVDSGVTALDIALRDQAGNPYTDMGNSLPASDIFNKSYDVLGRTLVTADGQVELKTGATRMAKRKLITVFNKGPKTAYYGPDGFNLPGLGPKEGKAIEKFDTAVFSAGPDLPVYIRSEDASIVIEEWA